MIHLFLFQPKYTLAVLCPSFVIQQTSCEIMSSSKKLLSNIGLSHLWELKSHYYQDIYLWI